jgi:hypothetical protein
MVEVVVTTKEKGSLKMEEEILITGQRKSRLLKSFGT